MVFSPSGSGTVTASTTTSLTVTGLTGLTAGALNAVVTSNGESSGTAVQVATVIPPPTVTQSTANLANNATTLTITGTSFSTTPGNNTVVFSPSGTGTVTASTATSLTVTGITGLTLGALSAVVTTSGLNSGAAVQVATVVPVPTVTLSTADLASNATTLTITGTNFSTTPGNNSVVFSPSGSGTVTASTTTSLSVTGITGLTLGALNAVVTSNALSSGAAVQVATVIAPPPSGALDTDFDPDVTGGSGFVYAMAVQPDGKTIIGGSFDAVGGAAHANIARLHADGSVDTSFTASTNNQVVCVAVQADGKIIIGGTFDTVGGEAHAKLARLNADGSVDTSFTASLNSTVLSMAVQSDGKILLGGLFSGVNGVSRIRIARLHADGSLDANFTASPNGSVHSMAVQADGKILLGGNFTTVNGTARNYIARLHADGSVDTSFDPGSGADTVVFSVAVQADDKILLGGNFTTVDGTARSGIARLHADGSLESTATFDTGTGASSAVYSMAVQADDKILLGGNFITVNGTARNYIARLHADGSVDTSFNPGTGANSTVRSVAVQADGRILLAGNFTSVDGTPRNKIARLSNDAAIQSLTAADTTQALWSRSGGGPAVSQVTFAQSSDGGSTWTALGSGTRVGTSADWQLTGLSLPTAGHLRARGSTAGGYFSGSSGLIEQVAAFSGLTPPAPTVTLSAADLASNATTLTITGTGFDATTPGNNTVAFSPSGTGTVTASTATSLTVTGITGLTGGALYAVVTTNGQSSGAAVQVATVSNISVTLTGGALTITDGAGGNDTLSLSESAGNLVIGTNAGSIISSNAGTGSGTNSVSLPLASITGLITLNAAGGTDIINIGAFSTALNGLTINGGTGNDTVNLNGDIIFAANTNLDVDLQDDDASPGTDIVSVAANANLILSGTGTATVKASKNVAFASGSSLVTADGDLTLEANQQGTATSGNFYGVLVNGATVEATGTGAVTVTGKGGDDSGAGQQHGVFVTGGGSVSGGTSAAVTVTGNGGLTTKSNSLTHGVFVDGAGSMITSGGSDVAVNGTGGGFGTLSSSNHGVLVSGGGTITAGGSGVVSVTGQGGNLMTGGSNNLGVLVLINSSIGSGGGNVTVVGTGGLNSDGVLVNQGTITAGGSGSVSVTGTGANSGTVGVYVANTGGLITSNGGDVTVTGTGGGTGNSIRIYDSVITTAANGGDITLIGDRMLFDVNGTVSAGAANKVTLLQKTNARLIDIGGADSGTSLGLTDGELDRISAGTLAIGDANSGNLTVSAAITHANNLSLTTGAGATFNQVVTMAVDKSLTVSALGTTNGTINLASTAADLTATGMGAISLTTARNIILANGSSIQVVDGDLALSANADGTTTGAFIGIDCANTSLISTGAGTISIDGSGGIGGIHGVRFDRGSISANGSGGITITGLTGTGGGNGIELLGFNGAMAMTSAVGDIVLTGKTRGSGAAGFLTGSFSNNISINSAAGTGDAQVIADSMIFSNVTLNAGANDVLLRPFTAGTLINLGGADVLTGSPLTLGLTDAELDLITASTLAIGDANSGAITISAPISPANYNLLDIQKGVSFSATGGFASDVTSASVFEKIKANGAVAINTSATLTATAIGGFVPAAGDSFTLLDNTSASTTTGTFSGKPEGTQFTLGGVNKQLTYVGATGNDIVLAAIVVLTPLETWRQTYFASPANSGNGANGFDFENDGIPNLIEFAIGGNPMQNSAHLLPKAQVIGSNLVLTLTQPVGVSGITYGAEWSTTLLPGSWTPITDTGVPPQHTFSAPIGSNRWMFMRMTVTDP